MNNKLLTSLATAGAVLAVAAPIAAATTVAPGGSTTGPVPIATVSPANPATPSTTPTPVSPANPAQPNLSPSNPDNPGTVSISKCTVGKSLEHHVFAFCTITSAPSSTGKSIHVKYHSNLATTKSFGKDYSAQNGKLAFGGKGGEIVSLKFGFKNTTAAKVRKQLKVTLSDSTGAVISHATARA